MANSLNKRKIRRCENEIKTGNIVQNIKTKGRKTGDIKENTKQDRILLLRKWAVHGQWDTGKRATEYRKTTNGIQEND